MNKLWKIISYEYRRHVLRKRFLVALLSVPLWIIAMLAISVLAIVLTVNNSPVGYVDHAGVLTHVRQEEPTGGLFSSSIVLKPYATEAAAREALDAKQIQAYYVLPEDYPQTHDASLYYLEAPSGDVQSSFNELLRSALLADQAPQVAQRLLQGPNLAIHSTQDTNPESSDQWFKVAAPIVAGIFMIVSVFTSGGYLMHAVVEEKENRTMEILATSVSPGQIMSGKVIALISVGLTQVLVWSIIPLAAILLVGRYLPFLQGIQVPWQTLGLVFLLAMPTFVLIASLMAAIGATVTEAREGQQITGLITLPVMSPFMLLGAIMANPNGPISLFLSFFPLTSALTLLLRIAFATVPSWQIWTGVAILLVSAVAALWFAGRVFRLGMLRYGQRLGWKDIFRSFQSNGRVRGAGKGVVNE